MNRTARPRIRRWVNYLVLSLIVSLLHIAIVEPLIRQARARSDAITCVTKARSIGAGMRAYASNWDGWNNPDLEHYVKTAGYRLNSEAGYFGEEPGWYAPGTKTPSKSQLYARTITDFVCPRETDPRMTRHGVPTSYLVRPPYNGGSVMSLTGEANRTLIVREMRKNHPVEIRSFFLPALSVPLKFGSVGTLPLTIPSSSEGNAQ